MQRTEHAITQGRFLLWATALFVAMNWSGIVSLLTEGMLRGPDDYLRFHQVREWINGQAWYDQSINRMIGSEIHWSRLVDLPIAGLALLFGLVFEPIMAMRLASVAWPFLLFLALMVVIMKICDPLGGRFSRLLVLFFAGINMFVMAEFAIGRIDHHNVQMLLLMIAIAGLFSKSAWRTALAIGISIPASVSVGLELLFVFLPVLAGLAIAWVLKGEDADEKLFKTGFVMVLASLAIYGLTISPDQYFHVYCDENSPLYLSALVGTGAGFMVLGALGYPGAGLSILSNDRKLRLAAGLGLGVLLLAGLYFGFPKCHGGPLANVSPELDERWLSQIGEARGLVESLQSNPSLWISIFGYTCLLVLISLVIVWQKGRATPHLATLAAILLAVALVSFFQFRVLRTGILASVPLCVIFAGMAIRQMETRLDFSRVLATATPVALCIVLNSWFWGITSALFFPPAAVATQSVASQSVTTQAVASEGSTAGRDAENRQEPVDPKIACWGSSAMTYLAGLPQSQIMTDLNMASPLLVHTHHTAFSGNYHRNGDEILTVLDFFGSQKKASGTEKAFEIAKKHDVSLVVMCRDKRIGPDQSNPGSLAARIASNQVPQWLEPVSSAVGGLAILRVVR